MARQRGAKCIPKERRKSFYDLSCLGVRSVDIAKYYKMSRSIVSRVLSRLRKEATVKKSKKVGRKQKLTERGMRLLNKYVIHNCFEPIYVIAARFNKATSLNLCVKTIRRCVKR